MEKLLKENDILSEVRKIVAEDGLDIPDDSCLRIALSIRDSKTPAIALHNGQERYWTQSDIRTAYYKLISYDITKQPIGDKMFNRIESILTSEKMELNRDTWISVVSRIHDYYTEDMSDDELKKALHDEISQRIKSSTPSSDSEVSVDPELVERVYACVRADHRPLSIKQIVEVASRIPKSFNWREADEHELRTPIYHALPTEEEVSRNTVNVRPPEDNEYVQEVITENKGLRSSEQVRIHELADKLAHMCPAAMAREFDNNFERALYVAQYYFKNN